jgi:hypothetical protein
MRSGLPSRLGKSCVAFPVLNHRCSFPVDCLQSSQSQSWPLSPPSCLLSRNSASAWSSLLWRWPTRHLCLPNWLLASNLSERYWCPPSLQLSHPLATKLRILTPLAPFSGGQLSSEMHRLADLVGAAAAFVLLILTGAAAAGVIVGCDAAAGGAAAAAASGCPRTFPSP